MQNIVEFHIIGRLGRIDAAKNVTHISVATNYNRREGETWKSDPQWHRITLFGKLRERIDNATIGDLVRITGRIGQSKYEIDGRTNYSVDLIADGFAILAKAKGQDCRGRYAGLTLQRGGYTPPLWSRHGALVRLRCELHAPGRSISPQCYPGIFNPLHDRSRILEHYLGRYPHD
ncbi:MAG: single-stranded DNA-binding protein [Sphingomonadales bacterium]|nr:single-stranded DNA-binding protein [Sphingomonadales bacterium]